MPKKAFFDHFFRKTRVLPPHPRASKLFFFAAGCSDHEECTMKKLDSREVSGILFEAIEVGSVGQKVGYF